MESNNTLILHIGLIIIFGTWYYYVCQKQNKDGDNLLCAVSSSLLSLTRRPIVPILIVVAGMCSQLFVSGVLCMLHALIPNAFTAYDKLVEQANSADTPRILILCICVLAPIGEELLFRGVILFYAKRVMSAILAVILQAILFGIYHGNVVQGIYAAFMGLILGSLVCHFKSLVPAILLHLVINVSMYLVPAQLYASYNLCIATTAVSGILLIVALTKILKCNLIKKG